LPKSTLDFPSDLGLRGLRGRGTEQGTSGSTVSQFKAGHFSIFRRLGCKTGSPVADLKGQRRGWADPYPTLLDPPTRVLPGCWGSGRRRAGVAQVAGSVRAGGRPLLLFGVPRRSNISRGNIYSNLIIAVLRLFLRFVGGVGGGLGAGGGICLAFQDCQAGRVGGRRRAAAGRAVDRRAGRRGTPRNSNAKQKQLITS
jgi:hypothetical protein